MFISELSGDECIDLLIRANFGRLACAKADQPYITPISFAYKNRKISLRVYCWPKDRMDAHKLAGLPSGGRSNESTYMGERCRIRSLPRTAGHSRI